MTASLLMAATRLADILAAENAALTRLDLAAAARLLPAKTAAADAFAAAQRTGAAVAGLRDAAVRLQALGTENRSLLECAIAVQNRVLGALAQATRVAGVTTGYGRTGSAAPRTPGAWAICSQA